jgi:hypothetical protein
MGIFVLSKDQTFRICATFLDPAKFFILVIHLIEKSKIENLLTLFQLTPLVGFLAMAEKIQNTHENFP